MIAEIDGVKIIVMPKQYEEHKKSLEKQLEEKSKEIEKLQTRNSRQRKANRDLLKKYNLTISILKEVKKFVKEACFIDGDIFCMTENEVRELVEILDKGDKQC